MVRSSATVKAYSDAFTSGASMTSPISLQSSMNTTTLSVLSISDESTAAMKLAG